MRVLALANLPRSARAKPWCSAAARSGLAARKVRSAAAGTNHSRALAVSVTVPVACAPSSTVASPISAPSASVPTRSEEHTSEIQSLMRISYAVFCLQKKNNERPKHKLQSPTDEIVRGKHTTNWSKYLKILND